MISSNTRATRSRFSSPANPRNAGLNGSGGSADASKSAGAASDGKTFLQRWLEPGIQSKTSFEEDGLMRYGVVENMAPLGTLPKAKKPGNEASSTNITTGTSTGVRRIILRPSGAGLKAKSTEDKAEEADAETNEPPPKAEEDHGSEREHEHQHQHEEERPAQEEKETPSLPRKKRKSCPAEISMPSPPLRRTQRKISLTTAAIRDAEDADAEYNPKDEGPRRRQSGRISIATKKARQSMSGRRRSSASSTKPAAAMLAGGAAAEMATSASASTSTSAPAKAVPRFEQEEHEWIGKVVESAVDEALRHYRYPTAWALRTLYDEKSDDADFVAMLEDVFNQTASADTMREFCRQIEAKKREGKRDNEGYHYFEPPSDKARSTPRKPKAAPYGKLITSKHAGSRARANSTTENVVDEDEDEDEEEMRPAKKPKTSHGGQTPRRGIFATVTPSSRRSGGAKKGNRVVDDNDEDEDEDEDDGVGGAAAAAGGGGGAVNAGTGVSGSARTPSRRRPRRISGSTDSTLSPAMSLPSPVESSPNSIAQQSPSVRGRAAAAKGAAGTNGRSRQQREANGGSGAAGAATGTAGAGAGGGGGGGSSSKGAKTQTQAKTKIRAKSKTQTQTQPPPPSSDGPSLGPITTRGKAKQALPSTSGSNSPTIPGHTLTSTTIANHSSASSGYTLPPPAASSSSLSSKPPYASMPGRLAVLESSPNPPPKSAKSSKDSAVKAPMLDEDSEAAWSRRREAQKVTNGFTALESSVRGRDPDSPRGFDPERDVTPVKKTRKTRPSTVASIATRATRSASKRPADDGESTIASPIALSPPLPDGSSTVGSRAVTPTNLRPAKRPRTGLRVKSSPIKRKGGTAAGVPRSVGEGNSSAINGTPKDQPADNDEYCSACGNNGDVVCCDGCPRSFHFECVDMIQSESLPDEWYCNECLVKKFPSRVPIHKGVFGSALNNLEKTIPRAFSLPKKLQNRFEGVKAGADGDYEDVATGKAARKKSGYEEVPDFYKQREDGQAVLCHDCQKPATDIRSIIPCSVCTLYWHIDCLDPPLAVPPVLKTWRCPAHVDDVLIGAPSLAPAHRFRKLKGAQPITPAISRGLKNNGHIEIDWTDVPEETNDSGWPDTQSFGRTYKVPPKTVILDVIEQLRSKGAGYGARRNEPKVVPYPPPPTTLSYGADPIRGADFARNVDEMQLSLNLVSLQQSRSEGIDQLRDALLENVDPGVLSLMAKANATNLATGILTDSDRLGLRVMLLQMDAMSSRIRFLLGDEQKAPTSPDMIIQGTTPISEPAGDAEGLEKVEPMVLPPATEPTPPSTIDQAEVDIAESSMDLD
ncbi:hypothetical protein B0I35DRAFT_38276 [Stachybotrys elegans]|uniref:PHD-type domain-containing protein n=1 Tax=Stachybotrys elegans TaxID=80388 RepID=A0A8K0T4H3_9HYPO|nr:hypothetical protein B0I35DRAFT_38276 [Stachybotrys elegans]